MNKRKIRRRKKHKLNLISKPWQTIGFMILVSAAIIFVWYLTFEMFFPDKYIKFGDDPRSEYDDFECFNRGIVKANTYEIICCYKHPFVTTIDHSENKTWKTTQCFKITNITQKIIWK